MMEGTNGSVTQRDDDEDPIFDIIDFLVRCAKISFKNSSINQPAIKTNEKIEIAYKLFKQSPTYFLLQFGKYLSPNHFHYFEKLHLDDKNYQSCVSELKLYHSNDSAIKRRRNRRFKALQRLQQETNYFSENQMMLRNPLLYEQLVGQYLTDEEIRERDSVDSKNLTFLNIILDTVDRIEMKEKQIQQREIEEKEIVNGAIDRIDEFEVDKHSIPKSKQWGDFDIPDMNTAGLRKSQKHAMINANERNLLREEFLQEMYSSFIEGKDIDFDYSTVDNNEDYDDLQQISQDAEDKYFDSEENDVETLEAHMHCLEESNKNKGTAFNDMNTDPLDVFMEHIRKKLR